MIKNILKLLGLMKIGDLPQRLDKAPKMKRMTSREIQRISTTTPTGGKEARDDAVIHVHLKVDLKSVTIIIAITIVTDITETDIPGREARPQADSDGPNARLKKPNEDKNAMQRE